MPIYDLSCSGCGHTLEAIVLPGEVEPTACPHCDGQLRRMPTRFFTPRSAEASWPRPQAARKSCGHASACRCAVKLDKPNPFAERIESGVDS